MTLFIIILLLNSYWLEIWFVWSRFGEGHSILLMISALQAREMIRLLSCSFCGLHKLWRTHSVLEQLFTLNLYYHNSLSRHCLHIFYMRAVCVCVGVCLSVCACMCVCTIRSIHSTTYICRLYVLIGDGGFFGFVLAVVARLLNFLFFGRYIHCRIHFCVARWMISGWVTFTWVFIIVGLASVRWQILCIYSVDGLES